MRWAQRQDGFVGMMIKGLLFNFDLDRWKLKAYPQTAPTHGLHTPLLISAIAGPWLPTHLHHRLQLELSLIAFLALCCHGFHRLWWRFLRWWWRCNLCLRLCLGCFISSDSGHVGKFLRRAYETSKTSM